MSDQVPQIGRQLSFDVNTYPHLEGQSPLLATVKASVELGIDHDLQPGESLVCVIQNADGEVIASGQMAVGQIGFIPIEEKGDVVGVHRQHKAKLVD